MTRPNLKVVPADSDRWTLINQVLNAPQESDEQKASFSAFVWEMFRDLERWSRRSFLPADESDHVALDVIEDIRADDYAKLRELQIKFEARLAAPSAGGRRTPDPIRFVNSWFRNLCRNAVRKRLLRLKRLGLLPGDEASQEAVANYVRSSLLIIGKIVRAETTGFARGILDGAAAELKDRQAIALEIYYQYTGDAPAGQKHERTRLAYAAIAEELKLDSPEKAVRMVTTAKVRLERAIDRLIECESDDGGDDEGDLDAGR